MKKYITIIIACWLAVFQLNAQDNHLYFEFEMKDLQEQLAKAHEKMKDLHINMDSMRKNFKSYNFKLEIDEDKLRLNRDSLFAWDGMDEEKLQKMREDFKSHNFKLEIDEDKLRLNRDSLFAWDGMDEEKLQKMREDFKERAKEYRKQAESFKQKSIIFSDTIINGKNRTIIHNYNFKTKDERKPVRTEKKTYSNISDIEFNHSYGNIEVQETNSKQVELEIRYFDNKQGDIPTASISTANKKLSVNTIYKKSTKDNMRPKIDYIISIPRGVNLSVNLKYGNVKMGDFPGKLKANMEYSNLKAKSLNDPNPQIKSRYGNITIEKVKEFSMSGDYTNINMNAVGVLNVSGRYNNYNIADVGKISSPEILYGNFKLGNLSDISVNDMKYVNFTVDNLKSNMDVDCSYSSIKITTSSPKVNKINISGRYSDISVSLPSDAKASFDTSLNYGKIDISNKYKVTYSQSEDANNRVVKVGKIGSGSPTTTIKITNNYANIKIK